MFGGRDGSRSARQSGILGSPVFVAILALIFLFVFVLIASLILRPSDYDSNQSLHTLENRHHNVLDVLNAHYTETSPKLSLDNPTYQNFKHAIINELKDIMEDNFESSPKYPEISYNSLKELIINDIRSVISPDWEQIQKQQPTLQGEEEEKEKKKEKEAKITEKDLARIGGLEQLANLQNQWITEIKTEVGETKFLREDPSILTGPQITRISVLEKQVEQLREILQNQDEIMFRLNSEMQYTHYQLSKVRSFYLEQTNGQIGLKTAKVPVKKRKLIFSINTGRCGSGYLWSLLRTSTNVLCYHEAHPRMAGTPLRMAKEFGLNATFNERLAKAYAVEYDLIANPDMVIAETSHLFISCFFDVILKYFPPEYFDIRVIALRRYFPDVLSSLVRLWFPTTQLYWYYTLNDKIATLPVVPDGPDDDWELALGYLIDVEAKIAQFKKNYPHIPVIDARLEEIQGYEAAKKMFDELDIEWTNQTSYYVGRAFNTKKLSKVTADVKKANDEIFKRIDDFYQRYREAGHGHLLPVIPNLERVELKAPNSTAPFQPLPEEELPIVEEQLNLVRSGEGFLAYVPRPNDMEVPP